MNQISRTDAVRELRQQVENQLSTDDIVEVFRELFPKDGSDRAALEADSATTKARVLHELVDTLDGVTVEEIWSVVFPQHRRVQFDSDRDQLTYRPAPVSP